MPRLGRVGSVAQPSAREALRQSLPFAFVPAGFDVIYQLSADSLARHVQYETSRSRTGWTYFEVAPVSLSDAVRAELHRRVLVATSAFVANVALPVSETGYSMRLRVLRPRLSLAAADDSATGSLPASVEWQVNLEVAVHAASGGGVDGLLGAQIQPRPAPAPDGPVHGFLASTSPFADLRIPSRIQPSSVQFIPIATGFVETAIAIYSGSDAGRFVVWAETEILTSNPVVRSPDSVFTALAHAGLQGAVSDALARLEPRVHLSPSLALVGLLRTGEAPSGIGAPRVGLASRAGVLAICVNLGPSTELGDLDLVQPFLAGRRFAAFWSLRAIRAAVRLRWDRADRPRSFEQEIPVQLSDPSGQIRPAVAAVRFTFLDLDDLTVVPVGPAPIDVLCLQGSYEVQLLRLRDGDSDLAGSELGEDGAPKILPFELRLNPDGRRADGSRATEFLEAVTVAVCGSFLSPILDGSPLREPEVRASAAVGGFGLRSNFDFTPPERTA